MSMMSMVSSSSAAQGADQSLGTGLVNSIGVVTPTFNQVFKAGTMRKVFNKRKRGHVAARPIPQVQKFKHKLCERLLKREKPCCARGCLNDLPDSFINQAAEWQQAWFLTPRNQKQHTLLQHIHGHSGHGEPNEVGTSDHHGKQVVLQTPSHGTRAAHCSWRFLGRSLCERSFQCLTGISIRFLNSARKQSKLGIINYHVKKRKRFASVQEEMRAAIWMVIHDLHHQSPYAGKDKPSDKWHIPFHHKVCLWRLVQKLHDVHEVSESKPAIFSKPPRYAEFRRAMVNMDFKDVVFHRMVDIGRCPRCQYMEWKCASVPLELRKVWQDALAKHHQLHMQQTKCYAADRAMAATQYPDVQLYIGMDCGSGHEFVLPHISSADREGPNKLLDNVSTVPMKVCNGLVHGDRRNHVILSPGVVGATANHTIECLLVIVNCVLMDQGVMPHEFTMQCDGASTNKCILVLAFLSLYLIFGVFRRARLRMELEHHAHDVYDAVQAMHAGMVKRHTYFHLEEMIGLIAAAHQDADDASQLRPVVGHDVRVSNLWEVRDFWEWLAPGYTEESTRPYALANAAFSSFSALQGYRDFMMELESGSTPENPRVGLWGKAYMTSVKYVYLGTIMTKQSFDAVTHGRPPPMQAREVAECKTSREEKCIKALRRVSAGDYSKQFPPERVADAIAMCQRDWGHFRQSKGAMPPNLQWLPSELAAELRRLGLRHAVNEVPDVPAVLAEQEHADIFMNPLVDADPPVLRQYQHAAADVYGFKQGEQTVKAHYPAKAPSDEDFCRRTIYQGCFVITRPAVSSHWAKISPRLRSINFWLWQIVRVHPPGASLPGTPKTFTSWVYEGHLFHPTDESKERGRWQQTWDRVGPQLLTTEAEKEKHAKKKKKKTSKHLRQRLHRLLHPYSKKSKDAKRKDEERALAKAEANNAVVAAKESEPLFVPLRSYLRPDNIIGGGFLRTSTGLVPRYVISYWERHCRNDP